MSKKSGGKKRRRGDGSLRVERMLERMDAWKVRNHLVARRRKQR